MTRQLYFLMLALLFQTSLFSMEERRFIDRENQLLLTGCEKIMRALVAREYYPNKEERGQDIDAMREALRQKHLQRVSTLPDGKVRVTFIRPDGTEEPKIL